MRRRLSPLFLGTAPKSRSLRAGVPSVRRGLTLGGRLVGDRRRDCYLVRWCRANRHIVQTNIKRMLAYPPSPTWASCRSASSGGGKDATAALSRRCVCDHRSRLVRHPCCSLAAVSSSTILTTSKGLNTRSPWFAFLMLLAMFSLGIPPTIGFWGQVVGDRAQSLRRVHLDRRDRRAGLAGWRSHCVWFVA